MIVKFLKYIISVRGGHCYSSPQVPTPLPPSLTQWCSVSRITGHLSLTFCHHIQVKLSRRKQHEHETAHSPSQNAKVTDVPNIRFPHFTLPAL